VQDLQPPSEVSREQADARIDLLHGLANDFVSSRPGIASLSHQAAYARAVRLMRTEAARAFDLHEEPAKVRDAYGRNLFGQGCLLARRLVERGVPFVEVSLANTPEAPAGWDTHQQNFDNVRKLCGLLDPAWAALLADLGQRGLLDSTLVVWMGEFGRTPQINPDKGRDHFPTAWSTVLAGGGIQGGQVVGKTSPDGTRVLERPVSVPDFLSTVCRALGLDPEKQNPSNVGRPIRIVEKTAQPLKEVLA
jgi:arylsulfatase A-like enzyme